MWCRVEQKSNEDFEEELTEDIRGECGKHGPIEHCKVDKNSLGMVWLKFVDAASCNKAISSLNQRWFAGRQIYASAYVEAQYNQKFGL